ncbi:MAG: Rieske 2Fe-2S domain-containing protein, partial [Candidatus Binatia bacterium]
MITEEENNLLTLTGKGTPCGELMRRHWQPVALSDELGADKPLPATILGEELILFRDGEGKPALIGRYCAHQGVDMIYGCVEPDGLRCLYHGWLFDNCGKVVLRGDWLPEKERRWDVGQASYPCVERGGIIFTYMGRGEAPTPSAGELFINPPSSCTVTKVLRSENYLQRIADGYEPTREAARFVMPNLLVSQDSSTATETLARWHVPVDDNSHVEFCMRYVSAPHWLGEPQVSAHQVLLKA